MLNFPPLSTSQSPLSCVSILSNETFFDCEYNITMKVRKWVFLKYKIPWKNHIVHTLWTTTEVRKTYK